MDRSKVSHYSLTLAHSGSIFKLQNWHLIAWHLGLQCRPLVEGDHIVSPFGAGVIEQHTNWLSSDCKWEVVELVALVWWICHL